MTGFGRKPSAAAADRLSSLDDEEPEVAHRKMKKMTATATIALTTSPILSSVRASGLGAAVQMTNVATSGNLTIIAPRSEGMRGRDYLDDPCLSWLLDRNVVGKSVDEWAVRTELWPGDDKKGKYLPKTFG